MQKQQVVIQIMREFIRRISADDESIELSLYPVEWKAEYHAILDDGDESYDVKLRQDDVDFGLITFLYLEHPEDDYWQLLFDLHLRLVDCEIEDFEYIRDEEEIEMGELFTELYALMEEKCGTLREKKERVLGEMLEALKKN